jgi:2'-5' RNA ligase
MTRPRFLVMAKPPMVVRKSLENVLEAMGLKAQLQGAMFDPANWHQSLTIPCDEPSAIDSLKSACARIHVPACTMTLNRIKGSGLAPDIHWAFHAKGTPACFSRLLTELNASQLAEGLRVPHGHRPHITISYKAPFSLASQRIQPIQWTIDELLLVKGHIVKGRFVYDVIESWPLQPLAPARQLDLFDGPGPG